MRPSVEGKDYGESTSELKPLVKQVERDRDPFQSELITIKSTTGRTRRFVLGLGFSRSTTGYQRVEESPLPP